MATIKNLFKSREPSNRFIFKDGHIAAFTAFSYYTSDEAEIAELNAEINTGKNPSFYVDPENLTVDIETLDPLAAANAEIEKLKQQLAKATDPESDKGSSVQEKLRTLSTAQVKDAAASSGT